MSYPVCFHQQSCLLAKFHPSAGCHILPRSYTVAVFTYAFSSSGSKPSGLTISSRGIHQSSWMQTSSPTFTGFTDEMWWQAFRYIFRNPACSSLRMHPWCMKILPSLIYLESRHMTSGEFPHQLLTTGILLWKNYADWLDENRPTYSYAIIFETWRPIRNSRTSLWWPHGRLSCNLVSYLLITRHLHQCRFNFGSLSMAGGNIRIV